MEKFRVTYGNESIVVEAQNEAEAKILVFRFVKQVYLGITGLKDFEVECVSEAGLFPFIFSRDEYGIKKYVQDNKIDIGSYIAKCGSKHDRTFLRSVFN